MSYSEFFADYWIPEPNTGCHIWAGRAKGRPVMMVEGKMRNVARLICEETKGPPPTPKHQAAHNTPNGCIGWACVNGGHLRWATSQENALDVPVELRSEMARKRWEGWTSEERRARSRKASDARYGR